MILSFLLLFWATLLIFATSQSVPLLTKDSDFPYPIYCAKNVSRNQIVPLASKNSPADLQLQQVQILIRHGARTPYSGKKCWQDYRTEWDCHVHYAMKPVSDYGSKKQTPRFFREVYQKGMNELKGTCHIGQLLDEGYTQELQNGRTFRNAYFDRGNMSLFQSNEILNLSNPSDFHFESDDEQRTIMSGQLVVESMFIVNPSRLNSSSQLVPWLTGDYKLAHYYPNSYTCPELKDIHSKWANSKAFKKWNNTKQHRDLDNSVKVALKSYNTKTLSDCLLTSKCSDKEIPNSLTPALFDKVVKRFEDEALLEFLYNRSEISKLTISPLLKDIRRRIKNKMSSDVKIFFNTPRFVLYSGHDTTLVPFLGALGGPSWLKGWVPYASFISIELYHSPMLKKHFVRILYQGKTLQIPGCKEELCATDTFMEVTSFAEDILVNCNVNADKSKVSKSNLRLITESWLFLCLLSLITGCLFGLIFGCCYRSNRNYEGLPTSDVEKAKLTLQPIPNSSSDE